MKRFLLFFLVPLSALSQESTETEGQVYAILDSTQFAGIMEYQVLNENWLRGIDAHMSEAVNTYLNQIRSEIVANSSRFADIYTLLEAIEANSDQSFSDIVAIRDYSRYIDEKLATMKENQENLMTDLFPDMMEDLAELLEETVAQGENQQNFWQGMSAADLAREDTLWAIYQWLQGNRGWGDTHTIEEVKDGVEGIDENTKKLYELLEPYYTKWDMESQPPLPLGYYALNNPEEFEGHERIQVYKENTDLQVEGNFFEQAISLLWQQVYETVAIKNQTILLLKSLASTNANEIVNPDEEFTTQQEQANSEYQEALDYQFNEIKQFTDGVNHLSYFLDTVEGDMDQFGEFFRSVGEDPPANIYFNSRFDDRDQGFNHTFSNTELQIIGLFRKAFEYIWFLLAGFIFIVYIFRFCLKTIHDIIFHYLAPKTE